MKILVVSQYFWPEEFRINDLAIELVNRGHDVTVLTGQPNYPQGQFFPGYSILTKEREKYNGINIIRVPLIPRGNGQGWRLAINYASFCFFASLLMPIYCKGSYDVIFVCQYSPVTVAIPAIIYKKIKCKPLVMWIQDLWPESLTAAGGIRTGYLLTAVEKVVKYIYLNCDKIFVQSQGFIPRIANAGIDERKINYLPNWAEELYMKSSIEKDAPKCKLPEGFRVMFAGNVGAAQDFPTVISAMELLKEHSSIHLIVLGDGRMLEWVKQKVQELGLADNIHTLGRQPLTDMPHYFSYADAMLVTLKNEEIFSITVPSKVQSYLASGKPIVAAVSGEGAKVISDAQAGIVCPPNDARALADAILKLYKASAKELQELGNSGREYFKKNFQRELLITRLESWLAEIIIETGEKNEN